ncbi:MAG: fimbrillin family protein [Rikenellaceae bacterium]
MVRKLLIAFALCAVITSCRKSSSSESTGEVSFIPEITTRATELYFETGDNINVTSFNSGAIHSENIGYTYNSSSIFTSTSPIEKSSSQTLTYIASYPVQSSMEDFSFLANTDQSASASFVESDLMMAIETSSSDTPTLGFAHVMTKMSVSLNIVNNSGSDVSITDMVFYAKRGSNVTCDVSSETISVVSNSASTVEITPQQESSNVYQAVISPQTISSGDLMATMKVNGSSYQWNMSQGMEFKSGKHYSYTWDITISSDGSSDSAVDLNSDITPWDYVDISSSGSSSDSGSAETLDKSNFAEMYLSGDATAFPVAANLDYGYVKYAFDGVNELLDYDTDNETNGLLVMQGTEKCSTIDLGAEYVLTEYKFWQRRWDKIYDNYNIRSFRLWGATASASEDDGATILSDYQVITDTGYPDFTTMGDKWIELVYEDGLTKPSTTELQEAAALEGHSYTITEQTAVRYIRIEYLKQWDTTGQDYYQIGELDFKGIKK